MTRWTRGQSVSWVLTCDLSVLTHTVDLTFFTAAEVNLGSHWHWVFFNAKKWKNKDGILVNRNKSALEANRNYSTQRADLPTSTKPQFSLARLIWHSSAPLVSSTKHWLIMRTSANKGGRGREGGSERKGKQWWSVFAGFLHHVMTQTLVSSQTRN